MRSDDALLLDMLLAARKIQRYVTGLTWDDFVANQMVQSAVIRELLVIGEAARRVTDENKASWTGIKWRAISGMRNRLVHEYFSVQLKVVWNSAKVDIGLLVTQLEQYIPPDLVLSE